MKNKNNYGKEYDDFIAQIEKGEAIQAKFFINFIAKDDLVLDFGCGRGKILGALSCKEKHGIEINKFSRKVAEKRLDAVFETIEETQDNYYDKIISNHALEHTHNPLEVLAQLHEKLKGGVELFSCYL